MVGKKRALAPAPLDVEPIRVPASLEREPLVVPTTPRSRLNTAACPETHQARRTVFLFLVHVLPMSSKLIRASPGRITARYHPCKCPTAVSMEPSERRGVGRNRTGRRRSVDEGLSI